MSKKSFVLIDAASDFQNFNDYRAADETWDWNLCFICQGQSAEKLICPAKNSKRLDKTVGCSSIANHLKSFEEIDELPSVISSKTRSLTSDKLCEKLLLNEAKYHKKCRNKYDDFHLNRISKKRRMKMN